MKTNKAPRNLVTVDEINNFSINEAYRALRTNLTFSVGAAESKCKKIAMTSSLPAEGKTLTTINTAIVTAQTDAKVLLVDCDLRRPRCHRYFSLPSKVGLSNVLSGMNKLDEALKHTDKKNLDFLAAGLIPPNPSELLSGNKMKALIEELSEIYDYIFLDTPPINVVSDAISLSEVVDGYVVVLCSAKSTHSETKRAIASLELAHANVLGFVLNNVRMNNSNNLSDKYKYYGYN